MIYPYIKGLLFHLFALLIWVTSSRGQTLRADLQLDSSDWTPQKSASKPPQKKKLGVDAAIQQLEARRLQILSSINKLLEGYSSSLRNGTVDDAKALGTLRVHVNSWIVYSKSLSKFADDQLRQVLEKVEKTQASTVLSPSNKNKILKALEKQKSTLLNYRDNLLPLIFNKRDPFNKVLDQCNELLMTVEVLGREQTVSLILKNISSFQEIHFPSTKK